MDDHPDAARATEVERAVRGFVVQVLALLDEGLPSYDIGDMPPPPTFDDGSDERMAFYLHLIAHAEAEGLPPLAAMIVEARTGPDGRRLLIDRLPPPEYFAAVGRPDPLDIGIDDDRSMALVMEWGLLKDECLRWARVRHVPPTPPATDVGGPDRETLRDRTSWLTQATGQAEAGLVLQAVALRHLELGERSTVDDLVRDTDLGADQIAAAATVLRSQDLIASADGGFRLTHAGRRRIYEDRPIRTTSPLHDRGRTSVAPHWIPSRSGPLTGADRAALEEAHEALGRWIELLDDDDPRLPTAESVRQGLYDQLRSDAPDRDLVRASIKETLTLVADDVPRVVTDCLRGAVTGAKLAWVLETCSDLVEAAKRTSPESWWDQAVVQLDHAVADPEIRQAGTRRNERRLLGRGDRLLLTSKFIGKEAASGLVRAGAVAGGTGILLLIAKLLNVAGM